MNDSILQIRNLKTYFFTRHGVVKAVDDVSFDLRTGECLCLVGESGCGKTATALSVLRLVDSPPGKTVGGKIIYHGEDLLSISDNRLRDIRGNKIAMIFQDPQTSLNPVLTIGDQVTEPLKLHRGLNNSSAIEKASAIMEQVGIPQARARMKDYPHQFSGGMKQRVMIASAISCDPEILIADEPTTALDATIKAQILDIFRDLKEKRSMSVLFITHDMGTVAEIADRIIVMYGGRVAETGRADDIFHAPKHPYTVGLLSCLPRISAKRERLMPIPGTIPSLIDPPEGCVFYPRCERHMPACLEKRPGETVIDGEHTVYCYLYS